MFIYGLVFGAVVVALGVVECKGVVVGLGLGLGLGLDLDLGLG